MNNDPPGLRSCAVDHCPSLFRNDTLNGPERPLEGTNAHPSGRSAVIKVQFPARCASTLPPGEERSAEMWCPSAESASATLVARRLSPHTRSDQLPRVASVTRRAMSSANAGAGRQRTEFPIVVLGSATACTTVATSALVSDTAETRDVMVMLML